MRKMIVIICITLMILMLSGCGNGQSFPNNGFSSEYLVPDLTCLATDTGDNTYWYVIDNNTGVVYLQFSGFRRGGITVALNADGEPLTVDQIRWEGKGR